LGRFYLYCLGWPVAMGFTVRYNYHAWIKRVVFLFVPGYTAGLARIDPVSPGLSWPGGTGSILANPAVSPGTNKMTTHFIFRAAPKQATWKEPNKMYPLRGLWMRGKSSCRKHSIHSSQPPEQHKTKTRKQHECKWLKNTEDTQKQTNIY